MHLTRRKRLLAGLLGLAVLLPLGAEARIQCWTNKDGVRECGNAVPPEYAQQETRTMDRRGITTEVRPRALTPQEQEAERRRQQEEQQREAEAQRQREEQERRDRVLLATYLTEDDIIRTQERMTSSINASIEITRINIDRLQERLLDAHKRAANHERQGREVPDGLQQDIELLERQIAEREEQVARREAERAEMIERYEGDLQRFRELQQLRQQR